ncbi:MAG: ATP--guanido phosphotransferase [Planctomycetota bacterium]
MPGESESGFGERAFDPNKRVEWLLGDGPDADVVLSSRVRLARNLAGFPFITRAKRTDMQQVLDLCRDRLAHIGLCEDPPAEPGARRLEAEAALGLGRSLGLDAGTPAWVDLHRSTELEAKLLAERHLISAQHASGQVCKRRTTDEPRGVAVAQPGERVSVMVNEEDHLRIQAVRSGLRLEEALQIANEADDRLEGGLDLAFSPRFGYLTACPTNVGTGVRLSVMLHLPGLRMTGEIDKVRRAAADMGLALRGSAGEGSEALGDLYQLSNQTTLGKSEQMLLRELSEEVLPPVVRYERHARSVLLEQRRIRLEDAVHRAVGTLCNARLVSLDESMNALSLVRLGIAAGLIGPRESESSVLQLLLLVQPAHLQHTLGAALGQEARKAARATLLRERLGSVLLG